MLFHQIWTKIIIYCRLTIKEVKFLVIIVNTTYFYFLYHQQSKWSIRRGETTILAWLSPLNTQVTV